MSSFTEPLQVEIQANGVNGKLLKEFDYHVGSEQSDWVVHVPAGFVTDFASSPSFAWMIFPKMGLYSAAAVLHDYLYQSKLVCRALADSIFREAMLVLGVPHWKVNIMYWGVRAFGFLGYSKNNLPK